MARYGNTVCFKLNLAGFHISYKDWPSQIELNSSALFNTPHSTPKKRVLGDGARGDPVCQQEVFPPTDFHLGQDIIKVYCSERSECLLFVLSASLHFSHLGVISIQMSSLFSRNKNSDASTQWKMSSWNGDRAALRRPANKMMFTWCVPFWVRSIMFTRQGAFSRLALCAGSSTMWAALRSWPMLVRGREDRLPPVLRL